MIYDIYNQYLLLGPETSGHVDTWHVVWHIVVWSISGKPIHTIGVCQVSCSIVIRIDIST